jgi:flagellin
MTLVINTNITSSLAQSNLSKVGDALQTTIQRLSSGLRVNSAADDASGYAIANRMDAQVRGMAVATRNANDAISFSQTASGALSQISNNLQRMRELAVQAANGSNSASDTSLLNQEFSQLQTEVSRIQGSTTFNNVSVFTASDTVFQIGTNTTANDRVNMQGTALTSTMSLGTQTITDGTTTTAASDISSAIGNAVTYAIPTNGVTTSSAQIKYVFDATTDAINANQKLSFASKNDALNTLSTIYNAYNSGKGTVATTNWVFFGQDLQNNIASAIAPSGTEVGLNLVAQDVNTSAYQVFQADAGGNPGSAGIYYRGGGIGVVTLGFKLGISAGTGAGQIGYAAAPSVISGQTKALSAISAIDSALTEVNTASAVQGALQNRFSAVISNLSAFSQSQTAAKSRIVDAEFATETAKLSRNQILQQAGTAMLAQANQLPSSVLSLLK